MAADAARAVDEPGPAGGIATLADLRNRVAPAVVLLASTDEQGAGRDGAEGASTPRLWPATLVTASGLAITSRHAVAAAIDRGATLAMVLGTHGKLAARNLAAALPVRIVATCDALDLALVEARPPASVFLPHLPIARVPSAPSTATARATTGLLAVTHDARAGLWAGHTVAIPSSRQATAAAGDELIPLDGDARGIAPGAPLFDALGQLAGLVVAPDRRIGADTGADAGALPREAPPRMVRAETLLKFVLAARGPELRFAGVPPYRRPVLGIDLPLERGKRDGVALAASTPGAASTPAGDGGALDLPKIAAKGSIDRFHAAPSVHPAPNAPGNEIRSKPGSQPGQIGQSAQGAQSAIDPPRARGATPTSAPQVGLALLESMTIGPTTGKAPQAKGDWEPRGPSDAPISITTLGDYHSPATREADAFLRELTRPDAGLRPGRANAVATPPVRVWWKDADRGFGDDYLLGARAARAAGEQGAFWPMHDLLMDETHPIDRARLRGLADRLDLDLEAFDTALGSEGLTAAVETENAEGSASSVLATPSFVVNGRVVEGGSVAVAVLAAALEDAAGGAGAGPTGGHDRRLAVGGAVPGTAYSDARTIIRTATRNVQKSLERANRGEGPTAAAGP